MDQSDITKIENASDSGQFNKKIVITSGEGAKLVDASGKEYIDCVGGHGVSVLGYSHPRITKAICEHLNAKRPITCGHFYDESRAMFFEKITGATPPRLKRVFLSNSGTESIEAALKFAMKYKKNVKNKEIVAMKRAFHGRTLGALSTTFNPQYRKDYSLLPGVHHASFGDIESVRESMNDNTVAVIMELVQGEGGVHPAPAEFPRMVQELCNERDVPFIIDEVQTGFGRTGTLFATEQWGIEPDILCLAKGIAGGIPMGATITTDKIIDALTPGAHGTTFGGNPLACRAAVESLAIIKEENLLEHSREVSTYLFDELGMMVETYQDIKEVRGRGLMIGIQFRTKVKDVLSGLQAKGVLALTAGLTVVRFLPPLVISMDEAKQVIESLRAVLDER